MLPDLENVSRITLNGVRLIILIAIVHYLIILYFGRYFIRITQYKYAQSFSQNITILFLLYNRQINDYSNNSMS